MNPPERFRAKLDRAGELLTTIENEITAYYASEPYVFRRRQAKDPPRLELVVESVRPPPLRLGVLLGEFIHDLRSTLDHVVWHLARTRVATPHWRVQFPIHVEEPDDWNSIVRDRLRDVPDDAVHRIWEVQPFHADRPNHEALAVVRSLSNEDKHHLILDSVAVPAAPDESHFEVQTFDIDEPVHIEAVWGAPLRPGMTLLTVRYTPTGPHPKIDVAARAPAEMIFGEMGFRAAAMRGVAGEIVRCVRSFERFFT